MRPEVVVRSRIVYAGRLLRLRVDEVRLPDGRTAQREVADHPGASVVVPFTAGGGVLMVRQYRHAVGETLLELPAGTLEPDEDPLACARRELKEEVGAEAAEWEALAVLYPSPGVMSEVMHLYLASGLTEGIPAGTEEETLATERLSLAEALTRVRRGEIRDAKSVAGLLLTAERIRR